MNQYLAIIIPFVFLVIIICLIVLIIFFPKKSSPIENPIGEMTPVSGPYQLINAVADAPGHIDSNLYPASNIWARYGYRAVKYDESNNIVFSSDIRWNSMVYTVMLNVNRENSGFTFRVPKQKSNLIDSDIKYELYVSSFDNINALGTPIHKEIKVATVNSDSTDLILNESTDPIVNKMLIVA